MFKSKWFNMVAVSTVTALVLLKLFKYTKFRSINYPYE